ncbi:hypothetical protein HMPREF9104_01586 [Lentilactobacillus kisonensis F0435]|uniref:Uncharacterized protein n=1 Tax=Lentilactobacillus kisonensis F0435 TaxID=797516 RepID=H1LG60_9LACO|nr:hypothetical protein HMPREF9104_01586 [Lentilactobacillus kisonensis F0435]
MRPINKEAGTLVIFPFVMATLITTFILSKAATNGRSLPFNIKMRSFQTGNDRIFPLNSGI